MRFCPGMALHIYAYLNLFDAHPSPTPDTASEDPAEAQASASLSRLIEVLPKAGELNSFLADDLGKLEPGTEADVPVQALRWTHDGINAQLAFGDDHEHADESIFKMFEQLFRGRLTPLDITKEDPLPAFLHQGPDGHLGLYSRRNRRLTAFLMYQALRRDELLMVRVLVCSPDA